MNITRYERPKVRGRRRAPRGARSVGWGSIRLMLLRGVSAGLVWAFYGPDVSTGAAAAVSSPVAVVDGDTFRYGGEKIRIADIDTPEVKGRCAFESELAARATDRLEELLNQGHLNSAPSAPGTRTNMAVSSGS